MEQNKKTIRISRSELEQMVRECIMEGVEKGEIDEALFGGLSGLANKFGKKASKAADMAGQGMKKMGQKVADTASKAGQKVADTASKAGQKVAGAAKSAGEFAKKQASDLKQGYEAGSKKQDYKKAWNVMKNWYSKGYFGKNRQAASRLSGLRNSMQNAFKEQFGEDLVLQ